MTNCLECNHCLHSSEPYSIIHSYACALDSCLEVSNPTIPLVVNLRSNCPDFSPKINCLECKHYRRTNEHPTFKYTHLCALDSYFKRNSSHIPHVINLNPICPDFASHPLLEKDSLRICPMCETNYQQEGLQDEEEICPDCLSKLSELEQLEQKVKSLKEVAKALEAGKKRLKSKSKVPKPRPKLGQRKIQF